MRVSSSSALQVGGSVRDGMTWESALHLFLSLMNLLTNGLFIVERIFRQDFSTGTYLVAGMALIWGTSLTTMRLLDTCKCSRNNIIGHEREAMRVYFSLCEELFEDAPIVAIIYNSNLNELKALDYVTLIITMFSFLRLAYVVIQIIPKSHWLVQLLFSIMLPLALYWMVIAVMTFTGEPLDSLQQSNIFVTMITWAILLICVCTLRVINACNEC